MTKFFFGGFRLKTAFFTTILLSAIFIFMAENSRAQYCLRPSVLIDSATTNALLQKCENFTAFTNSYTPPGCDPVTYCYLQETIADEYSGATNYSGMHYQGDQGDNMCMYYETNGPWGFSDSDSYSDTEITTVFAPSCNSSNYYSGSQNFVMNTFDIPEFLQNNCGNDGYCPVQIYAENHYSWQTNGGSLSNSGWVTGGFNTNSMYYISDAQNCNTSNNFEGYWGSSYNSTSPPSIDEMNEGPFVLSPTMEMYTNAPGYLPDYDSGTTVITLNNLYTDSMLWGFLSNMTSAYPPLQPGGQIAESIIFDDHTEGYLQPVEYRFKIPPPTEMNVTYQVTWDVVVIDQDLDFRYDPIMYVITNNMEDIKGTGDPSDYAYGVDHYLVPPFYSTDCDGGIEWRYVANVQVTVLKQGSPPGSGPGPGPASGDVGPSGCTSCSSMGHDGGMLAEFSLGSEPPFGQPAGNLRIWAATANTNLATPAGLIFVGETNAATVIYGNNQIQQVNAPQALANIVTLDPYDYEICYYYTSQVTGVSNGLYQTTGSPYVTWLIQNPNTTNSANITEITETRGASTWIYTYAYNPTNNSWTYTSPGGIRQLQLTTTDIATNTATRILSGVVTDTNGTVIRAFSRAYQQFPWGEGVVSETDGTGPTAKTTTWSYNNGPFLSGSAEPVSQVNYPNGSYISYSYVTLPDGTSAISGETEGGNDGPGYIINYDYTPLGSDDGTQLSDTPRTIVKQIGNAEISRTYLVMLPGERDDIQCTVAGAAYNNPGNLVTVTKYYTNGPNIFRVASIANPDGTMSFYNYAQSANGWQTNTIATGEPNSGQTTIVDGSQAVTILDPYGQTVSVVTTDIASGAALQQDTYGNFDPLDRAQQVTHLDGTTNFYDYACCYLEGAVDADGVLTEYLYDAAKRNIGYEIYQNTNGNPIAYENVLDPAGQVVESYRVGTNGSMVVTSQSAYDTAGRLIAQTNALGGVTTYVETNDPVTGGLIDATVNPDGGTSITAYYGDGTLKSITGTAVHGVYYESGNRSDANGNNCLTTTETKLNPDGSQSSEWTMTYTALGRTTEVSYPDNSYSQTFYNPQGQLAREIDPDGVTTLYQYDAKGELAYTAVDMNQNGVIDFSGTDHITQTTNDVTTDHGTIVNRIRTYVWLDGQSTGTLVSAIETSADGLNSWETQYRDAGTAVTTRTQTVPGVSRTVTTTAPDGSYTVNNYSYGRLVSSTRYDSTGAQIGGITYGYDAQGRQNTTTDARNGTTTEVFNNADLVATNTTPNPGDGSPEVTATLYDNMLRPYSVIQPDGTMVNSAYLLTGELGLQYGSRTYPVAYSYDYSGRMLTMTNWSNFSVNSGARVTTWNYDANRGWLDGKTYDSGTPGPAYTYTPAGRLASRTWARGITTSYAYDNAGSLTNVSYNDGVTPGVTNAYDRLGRLSTATWNGITDTLAYNLANQLLSESYTGGTLNGLAVTNGYDADLRRTALSVLNSSTILSSATYGYDNASRLSSVTDGNNNSATYSYLPNSILVGQITFKQGSTTRLTTIKQYDYLNRLTQISSAPGAAYTAPLTYNYNYNTVDQRTKNTLADGSYWVYGYDSLGQVTNGCKFFANGTPVPGQQFDYTFDTTGNRTQTMAGGDTNGVNLRVANYFANNLNQLTNRDVPPYVDIMGASILTNTVTVNGQIAYRNQEYFRQQLPVNNTNSALWTNITVSGGQTVTGNIFVAQEPETFQYDADGNLTNDGRWSYMWDGENRLIQMTVNTNVGSQYQLTFAYDPKGRRIQKMVATNGVGIYTNNFLYDDWNLAATLSPSLSLLNSFMWGNDLSGSPQGAGGVGGLMEITYYGSTTTNCFPTFDGNGNIMALVNVTDGTVDANYEYGPFGEIVRSTGPMAKANSLRFSTKYNDDESDLLYYGYRYYKQATGDWVNRDPLMESGSRVLRSRRMPKLTTDMPPHIKKSMDDYTFLNNSPLDDVDALGLCSGSCGPDITRPLERTLLYVAQDFWSKSETAQIRAGDRMYSWDIGPFDWDIVEVHTAARYSSYDFDGNVTCGPGYGINSCASTLTFERRCYYATAINYALWGKMNELEQESEDLYGWKPINLWEHFSLNYAISVAELWKRHYGNVNPVIMDQVGSFVRWGYTGLFVRPLTSPCDGSSCTVTLKRFDYVWDGIHNIPIR